MKSAGERGKEQQAARALPTDRRIALGVAACFFLFYLPFFHGHFYGTDEWSAYEVCRNLYKRADLAVVVPAPHHFEGRDGRLYSHFALGPSVLAIPLHGLGTLVGQMAPDTWVRAMSGRKREGNMIDTIANPEIFAVALYSPIASAALVGMFFLFERRLGSSLGNAVRASVLLGATTYVAMMSSTKLLYSGKHLTTIEFVPGM